MTVEAAKWMRSNLHKINRAARRVFDIFLASVALLVAAPFMFIIAVAIIVETPGPVFFSQLRVGRDGQLFRLYKFRKFDHRLDCSGRAVTLRNDPRMTVVGRFIERTKLDELPQLWNVLVGNMAMVGPRPESLEFAECYTGPFQNVLDFTPGIFGPSQAIFRNESSLYPPDCNPHEFYRTVLFPRKARIDLSYFPTRTIVTDIGWILRGVVAIFGPGTFANTDVRCLVARDAPLVELGDVETHKPALDEAS